jgi:hypothetical protein
MVCRMCSGTPRCCEGQWDLTNRWIKTASYLGTNDKRIADGVETAGSGWGRRGRTGTKMAATRRRRVARDRDVGGDGTARRQM